MVVEQSACLAVARMPRPAFSNSLTRLCTSSSTGLFPLGQFWVTSAAALIALRSWPVCCRPVARGSAGLASSLSRIGAAIGTYLVPMSLESLGIANTMIVAFGISMVGLLCTWLMAPETRSLDLAKASAV